MSDDKPTEVWERQPWETEYAYDCFISYYVPTKKPRVFAQAYRDFLVKNKKLSREEAKGKQISVSWLNWKRGASATGENIEGSLGWPERAKAYDESGFDVREMQYTKAREELVGMEIKDANTQLVMWKEVYGALDAFYYESKRSASEDEDKEFNPSKFISHIKEMAKLRNDLAIFLRRTVGLPATIKPTEDSAEKEPLKIEWTTPDGLEDDIGIGEDEVLDAKEETAGINQAESTA